MRTAGRIFLVPGPHHARALPSAMLWRARPKLAWRRSIIKVGVLALEAGQPKDLNAVVILPVSIAIGTPGLSVIVANV